MVDVGDGQPKSTSGKKKTTAVEAKSSSKDMKKQLSKCKDEHEKRLDLSRSEVCGE
jgi:hypothetical protein